MIGTELTEEIKRALASGLAGRPEILFAVLYGSSTEGIPFRDLDVGLFVDRSSVRREGEWEYMFSVADILESTVPYPVDVRIINDGPIAYKYNVSRGQLLLANDEEAYYDFLETTWTLFLDLKPFLMQYFEEI